MHSPDIEVAEKRIMVEFLWLTENRPRWKYRSLAVLYRQHTCSPDQTSCTVNRIVYGIFNRAGRLVRTVSCPNRKPLGSNYPPVCFRS